ncbi:taurine ABC transporter substrate-binding protein [Benzoatithermus flavus]|uniref:Taurine ABC transporter substrate-binding protein n=1 Tax=Benzoatithermus flavus TaxID=3108223 RepID=A0ABU8XZW6_9PROT
MTTRRWMLATVAAASLLAGLAGAAEAKDVTIGYQLIYSPWAEPIVAKRFEKETGYSIRWVKFDSGAKVITAMASGQVDIAVAGSSPIAAAASQGIDFQLFWLLDDINEAEVLVARDGSGIDPKQPATLKGKTLAVPFVSTAHFHTLFALETWGIQPSEIKILNMQPNQIAAAWERGDIDAAFVWDPALARIKKSGKVMVTSGELSAKGKATFDGLVAMRKFAEANPEFMTKFVRIIDEANAAYRQEKGKLGADSPVVKANVELLGGEPQAVIDGLALYGYPAAEEQASPRWLGGGADGIAVKALQATAEFLKAQGKVDQVLPDYTPFVTPAFAAAAAKARS